MNRSIKEAAKAAGVKMWQIAKAMGISDMTLCRRMREDLSPEQEQEYIEVIKKLSKED